MSHSLLSRRDYLRLTVIGSAALGSAALWTGCSRDEDAEGFRCDDESGLSEADKTTRSSMQYVDDSPHADKSCANCSLFKAPEEPGSCGGCEVVKGPIHPDGWCTAWAAADAS